jgi:signal-transduction protein with cAMP-binding, CBS, and nucleotidyltransferase domain
LICTALLRKTIPQKYKGIKMEIAADILKKKGRDMICLSPDRTITQALNVMVESKIGAILIKEKNTIIGIWTERDLMRNVITKGFDPNKDTLREYMSTNLHSASHTDSLYKLLDKFLDLKLRHLLIEKNGEYIGMISRGDVIKALLIEKIWEFKQMNNYWSWENYEK